MDINNTLPLPPWTPHQTGLPRQSVTRCTQEVTHHNTPHSHQHQQRQQLQQPKKLSKINKKNHPDAAKKCSNQHVFCLFVGKKSFQETQCAPGSWKERCHRNQRPWRGTHWVTQGVPGNDCVSIYIYSMYLFIYTLFLCVFRVLSTYMYYAKYMYRYIMYDSQYWYDILLYSGIHDDFKDVYYDVLLFVVYVTSFSLMIPIVGRH